MKNRQSTAIRTTLVVLVGLAAITWGVLKLSHATDLPPRFAVVESGVIYRSGQPSTVQLRHMIDQFGLRTLLIVREAGGSHVKDEMDFARKMGLNVVHIPIESKKQITERQVEEFLRCVDDRASAPILVHCSAGRHRTGYLCARYRIDRQGWPLERAIQELLSFGFDTRNQAAVLDQLRNYRPANQAAGAVKPATFADRTRP